MVTMIHNPVNEKPITELYAYISIDKDGNEGICGAPLGVNGTTMPLVFGYERVALKFMPIVEELAENCPHMQFKLVKFTQREEIQTIRVCDDSRSRSDANEISGDIG